VLSAKANGKATIHPNVSKELASALVSGALMWTAGENCNGQFKLYIALLLTLHYELKKTGGRVQVSLIFWESIFID
jgi:hypothetical protein